MKITFSLSTYDVDHMPGRTLKRMETLHDKYDAWKKHADAVNGKYHDDNAESVSDSKCEYYEVDGIRFAYWDKVKRIGTVHNTGGKLSK